MLLGDLPQLIRVHVQFFVPDDVGKFLQHYQEMSVLPWYMDNLPLPTFRLEINQSLISWLYKLL